MNEWVKFIQDNGKLIIQALLTHLELVVIAVGTGFILAVPLGILLSRHKSIARYVLAVIGIIQTIPGLVLLGIALILFGLGKVPAIFVLVLYAILPILQNTYTGINEVEDNLREAAKGNGMTNFQILFKVELPLALASIIAGLRISTVYIISWATLAALIGAGGLGDLIWTGLASYDNRFILAGAVPASVIAVLSGILFNLLQNAITSRGLKAGLQSYGRE